MGYTTDGRPFPDVSSCTSLKLTLKSTVPYSGYRVSFGNKHAPDGRFAFGYKANMILETGSSFEEVIIPFNEFTYKWDDATGEQIISCKEDSKYCPDKQALQDLKTIAVWGEGLLGNVHLEIKSISAIGCSSPSLPVLRKSKNNSSRVFGATFFLIVVVAVVLVIIIRGRRSKKTQVTYKDIPNTPSI